MGAVGSPYDNALVESFWGRMQVELFNRRRWTIRIELANAIPRLHRALPQHPPASLSPRHAHAH
jgi:transposase InsO family protein